MSSSAMVLVLFLTQISGGVFTYEAQRGESLTTVGARFGVDVRVIAESNNLKATSWLKVGQVLRIDNRHIIPESRGSDIVINVPQRMLFYYEEGTAFRQYPIAAGKPNWRTPTGAFSVLTMERDPVWDVPPSIQEEMRRDGKPVVTRVPPSPENPLGKYWIGLSLTGVGIHGTNAPSSIYKAQTHGCIRLHPDDIQDLFALVDVGARGWTIYETILMTRTDDSVFLEVHPDIYNKAVRPLSKARDIARAAGLSDMVDWSFAEEVIRKRDGIARDVTRR